MTSLENVERIIEEWFDDYITIDGIKGIIKLYAKITNECEKNLDCQLKEIFGEMRADNDKL